MVTLIIAVHVTVCIAMVIVVLLQQGKGADIGAVFGGSSQTVFGSGGAGNFLTKLTAAFAAVFFATSMFLAYASTKHATGSILEGATFPSAPIAKQAAPNKAAAPAGAPATPVAPAQKQ